METLTGKSRATLGFELRWQSAEAAHAGCLWADMVSFFGELPYV